jgi:hypothetical protein
VVTAPARREVVREMVTRGLSERRALTVAQMSAAALRYVPRPALAGHADTVRLLVQRGARVDIKDILWNGTPADWADHGGHPQVPAYLRAPTRPS